MKKSSPNQHSDKNDHKWHTKYEKLHLSVSKVLSDKQINLLMNPKKRFVHWTSEDMAKAVALHTVSSKAYNYLRECCKWPLPSISTLKREITSIDMNPGILSPVLNVLRAEFFHATPMERQCIIAFDEAEIDSSLCYNEKMDKILGPHKHVIAYYARGLFYDYKQLIYYNFDENPTRDLLQRIISEIHSCGLNVVGICSDAGTKNQALWKELNVSMDRTHFNNPVTGNNVYVFADFPHMLKLVRNHLLDSGFILNNGKGPIITTEPLYEILKYDKSEFKICHNLTESRLEVRGKGRQNVRMAFQTFSESVAKAMVFINSKYEDIAKFYSLMNNFSDLMNTRTTKLDTNPFKCAYGLRLEEQNALLDEVKNTIASMTVRDGDEDINDENVNTKKRKKALKPFQKFIIISITSIQNLLSDMKKSPIFADCIMTKNANQDFVEAAFAILRGLSGFDIKPNPNETVRRAKTLAFGWNFLQPKNSSVTADKNTPRQEFMSIRILSSLKSNAESVDAQEVVPLDEKIEQRLNNINTDFTAPTQLESISVQDKCEEGGLEYVARFIAKKLMDKYPALSKMETLSKNPSWIQYLSNGGLTEPSEYWLAHIKKFEEYFSAFHGLNSTSINKCNGVVKNLTESISNKFPDISPEIIKYYAKTRTIIRMDSINAAAKQYALEKFKFNRQLKLCLNRN